MSRRNVVIGVGAAAATRVMQRAGHALPVPMAQNVVLIHGLFVDGSCWSEVIARLQARGIRATAVQNPLTTYAVGPIRQVVRSSEPGSAAINFSYRLGHRREARRAGPGQGGMSKPVAPSLGLTVAFHDNVADRLSHMN
jgi:hypothetical protein